MNIIEAWLKAESGDVISKPSSTGKHSYLKDTNMLIPGLYDAVDYAKKVWCLSCQDWVVTPGLMVGGHKVREITNKGFKVGCQEVSWDTAEKIMALRPKEE